MTNGGERSRMWLRVGRAVGRVRRFVWDELCDERMTKYGTCMGRSNGKVWNVYCGKVKIKLRRNFRWTRLVGTEPFVNDLELLFEIPWCCEFLSWEGFTIVLGKAIE
jgi:hypothetical protein